jgi:hypothetical protein
VCALQDQSQIDTLIPLLALKLGSVQEAINRATEITRESIERFEAAEKRLIEKYTDEKTQEDIRKFINGSKYASTANLNWRYVFSPTLTSPPPPPRPMYIGTTRIWGMLTIFQQSGVGPIQAELDEHGRRRRGHAIDPNRTTYHSPHDERFSPIPPKISSAYYIQLSSFSSLSPLYLLDMKNRLRAWTV